MTLDVTDAAITEIKKFMAGEEGLPETSGLRVRVVPGGCSGFQYSLNIEEDSRQGDFILDQGGVKLFVDMFSAQYLNGVKIDYVTGVMGSGFTFTNPNATGSCGCGTSFTA
jgi:iron-sulfur cluster assembly protein